MLFSFWKRNREFFGYFFENGFVDGVYFVGGIEYNNVCRNIGGVG